MTPYVYLAVRSDLTFRQQLVQSAHASQESGAQFGCPPNCHMVVFEVNGIEELHKFCETCHRAGIQYSLFYEPDNELGHTAACTEPVAGAVRSNFRHFKLLEAKTLVRQDTRIHQQA